MKKALVHNVERSTTNWCGPIYTNASSIKGETKSSVMRRLLVSAPFSRQHAWRFHEHRYLSYYGKRSDDREPRNQRPRSSVPSEAPANTTPLPNVFARAPKTCRRCWRRWYGARRIRGSFIQDENDQMHWWWGSDSEKCDIDYKTRYINNKNK